MLKIKVLGHKAHFITDQTRSWREGQVNQFHWPTTFKCLFPLIKANGDSLVNNTDAVKGVKSDPSAYIYI